jgi:hypothetical protein
MTGEERWTLGNWVVWEDKNFEERSGKNVCKILVTEHM